MKNNYLIKAKPVIFSFLCLVFLLSGKYASGDTTNVHVVDHYLWLNYGHLDSWAVFPDSSKRYEKILMHYKLECPTGGCGEWDYTSGVFILTANGPLEIGRFITPYGKWFAKGRQFDWVFDITDYAYLLRDSVQLRVSYEGYSQGSIFTLDIEMIEGIAPKDVYRIEKIYGGAFEYGNPARPIEDNLPAKNVTVDALSGITTLKITTTGHGFGGTEDAAEFSDKTHTVNINGTQQFTQHLWRDDCGQNPVYPQAGTWYYNRGGWCPGDVVHPFYFDLTPFVTPGQPVEIDYNMQPYTNLDTTHRASYIVEAQVMFASAPNFQDDAALMEIRKPNNDFRFRRMNPVCNMATPEIEIRNTGNNVLKSLTIKYGVGGVLSNTFNWTGTLNFMDTETVDLPSLNLGTTASDFTATISNPNGKTDAYAANNSITVSYDVPANFKSPVALRLVTDDLANSPLTSNGIVYEVRDMSGNVLYADSGFLDAKTILDTFNLVTGCYQFIIYDRVIGDGLFPIVGTTGSYLLRDADNKIIINGASAPPDFLSSFGDREIITFTIVAPGGIEDPMNKESLNIFPNPGTGEFKVDLSFIHGRSNVTIKVYAMNGQCIINKTFPNSRDVMLSLDLNAQPDGIYQVSVEAGHGFWSKRVVKASGN